MCTVYIVTECTTTGFILSKYFTLVTHGPFILWVICLRNQLQKTWSRDI